MISRTITDRHGNPHTFEVTEEQDRQEQIVARLGDATTHLRAYRDLDSPTAAQTVACVRLLCRVALGLIRLTLHRYDDTE